MKHLLSCLFVIVALSSCSHLEPAKPENAAFETQIAEWARQDMLNEISLAGMTENSKKIALSDFNDLHRQINFVDVALNKGYQPLLEDIDGNTYGCIGKETLKEYQSSGWEIRNIGFPNVITRLKGTALLQRAKTLQYEILIIKLLKNKALLPLAEKKEQLLKTTLEELTSLTEEKSFVD